MESLMLIVFLAILLAVYFLPSIIPGKRNTKSQGAIFMLTLLLGWTLLGWLVAAIWTITKWPIEE